MLVLKRATIAGLLLTMTGTVSAQARVEKNVVYGMYSGLALLMDVHYPEQPNGYGIVFINGSGYHMPLSLDAPQLKDRTGNLQPLVSAGYTVFSINHRAAPRFRHPSAIEDGQRAVRFVRHNADQFGIDPERIGAAGGSSGGHLALMLGVLDGTGKGSSPVDQESSKVQTVAVLFPATDLVAFAAGREGAIDAVASFMGVLIPPGVPPADREALYGEEFSVFRDASPIGSVSPDDPPFLLIHGDADQVVPFEQSEIFVEKLKETGVTGELIRVPGGGHGGRLMQGPNPPDVGSSMVGWFDRYLQAK